MKVNYSESKCVDKEQLQQLYLANDWDSGNYPDKLVQAIGNSHGVFTAWDGDQLVGLANVLSDGNMAAYIHYMLVHPDYQGMGIGRGIMERLLAAYEEVPHKVLVAYGPAVGFYENCGFYAAEGKSPMFLTELNV